jgi:hypothetical protein
MNYVMKKKLLSMFVGALLVFAPFTLPAEAAIPDFNLTGNYVISFTCSPTTDICPAGTYLHDMTLSQDASGNLTGSGGFPAGGTHTYHWVLTSGTVSANDVSFDANYTMGASGTMHVEGEVASNGSISGTWTDNVGGSRSGTFTTTSGAAINLYDLNVSLAGTGTGNVSASGINCGNGGSDCSQSYNSGASVTLTATAAAGSTFSGFSGGGCTTSPCTITMNADKAVTATFTANVVEDHTVTVSKTGTGSGTVTSSPIGIDCGSDCSNDYDHNTSVVLTATAASDSDFSGWSGACSGSGNTCTLTVNGDKQVTANFTLEDEEEDEFTITASAGAHGSISPSGSVTVDEGDDQAFTFNAHSGYDVANVIVDGVSIGVAPSYTFHDVDADHTISVSFELEDDGEEEDGPRTKAECKLGGWMNFSTLNFKNQGQCIAWFNNNR